MVSAMPVAAQESSVNIDAIVSGSYSYVRGQKSWLSGGFGRVAGGGETTTDADSHGVARIDLGFDVRPTSWLALHVHGLGRLEPNAWRGESIGLVEAYADVFAPGERNELRVRAGQFFLPTSRENVESLWSSPYTLTLSALNSWVAEEVRPVGVDVQWRRGDPDNRLTLAATVFRGNDSSGTLLGWRGWAMGNRLSVYDEVLPLPPLFSLTDPNMFVLQRKDGTKPFGTDLDSRDGHAARARYQNERFLMQLTASDNRGDRQLHRGEYAWRTRFITFAGEYGSSRGTTIAVEAMRGSTGMGAAPGPHVDLTFATEYFLISQPLGRHRLSARLERFETDDRDASIAEANSESGRAWTLCWMYEPTPRLRAAIEFVQTVGERVAIEQSGGDRATDARSLSVELRYRH